MVTIGGITKAAGEFTNNGAGYEVGTYVNFVAEADGVADAELTASVAYEDGTSRTINLDGDGNGRVLIQEGVNTLTVTTEPKTYTLTNTVTSVNSGWWNVVDSKDVFGKEYKAGDTATFEIMLDEAHYDSLPLADRTATVTISGGASCEQEFYAGVPGVEATYTTATTDTRAQALALAEVGNLYKDAAGEKVATIEDWDNDPDATFYYCSNVDDVKKADPAVITVTVTMSTDDAEITAISIAAD